MEVHDEGSDQKSDVQPQWIAVHACLKIEFTEGDKCHNLMSRLKCKRLQFCVSWRKYLQFPTVSGQDPSGGDSRAVLLSRQLPG